MQRTKSHNLLMESIRFRHELLTPINIALNSVTVSIVNCEHLIFEMSLLNYFQKLKPVERKEPGSESDSENDLHADIEQPVASASALPSNENSASASENDMDRSSNENPKVKRRRKADVRHYNPSFLQYGFICGGNKEMPIPVCVLCNKTLSNKSMKPAHLIRHLKTKHSDSVNKPLEYF